MSDVETIRGTDLTRFRIDILSFLHKRSRTGADLQRELEEYYGEDLNHRRVYDNLDALEEMGLVEKLEHEISDKTHLYEITDDGKIVVYEYGTEMAVRLGII